MLVQQPLPMYPLRDQPAPMRAHYRHESGYAAPPYPQDPQSLPPLPWSAEPHHSTVAQYPRSPGMLPSPATQSGMHRHTIVTQNARPQLPSLPGLRDILNPSSPLPHRTSVPAFPIGPSASIAPLVQGPPTLPANNGFGSDNPSTRHIIQPLVARASQPPELSHLHHTQPERRVEHAVLENTGPNGRMHHHAPPIGSYYPDQHEYVDARSSDRVRQPSSASYLNNGAPSPYGSSVTDDSTYAASTTTFDRPPTAVAPPVGVDIKQKYVGVQQFSGEGFFHVYEGGYRLPTQIDGEQVNPAWGLTKANKPRKRLALACIACREKKIKCEPRDNSCVQCEKAKRVCRRTNLPIEPNSVVTWPPPGAPSPMSRTFAERTPSAGFDSEMDLAFKRRAQDEPLPRDTPTQKKQRSMSPNSTTLEATHAGPQFELASHTVTSPRPALDPGLRVFVWESDPYAVDPVATKYLLALYFTYINGSIYRIFPRDPFLSWVESHPEKSANERLLLYAIMAMGSVFADPRFADLGQRCSDVAQDAIGKLNGQNDLHLVQARLMITFYDHAKGYGYAAWDSLGSAIRAATNARCKWHLDKACREDSNGDAPHEFGMSAQQVIECKRRTFWSCYLMDRFAGESLCMINSQDIAQRLPCSDEAYDRGQISDAAMFSGGVVEARADGRFPGEPASPMACLLLISVVWGDVLDFLNRATNRPPPVYAEAYEAFYDKTHADLDTWRVHLPSHLTYNPDNLRASIHGGYASCFVTMHALYHYILLKLNRCVRHRLMPAKAIPEKIRGAHLHARYLLDIMCDLQRTNNEVYAVGGRRHDFFFSTPFPGRMTMAAIDVIGAGGYDNGLNSTLELIQGGLAVLRDLGRYWNSAYEQLRACEKRFYQINNIVRSPVKAKGGCWIGREWGIEERLEQDFDLDNDCIFGIIADEGKPHEVYFNAVKDIGSPPRQDHSRPTAR